MDEKPGVFGRINISIAVGIGVILSTAVVATLITYVYVDDELRSLIRFGAALVGGAAAIYGGFYAGRTLQVNVERSRQSESFEILKSFNEVDNVRVRVFIDSNVDATNTSHEELFAKSRKDLELREAIVRLLGVLEDTSIAIQVGLADETVLALSLGSIVPWAWNCLQWYIQAERKFLDDPAMFRELERLYLAWSDEKYLASGKPFTH